MADAADRPFPPGEYPVIVVGSGPGGLQVSYGLRRHGVPHAVLSADEGAGGMFRRWPFFQRLLSWTKPYAPAEKHTREFQRYDWNSLIADEPELRSLQTEFMDGSSYFPSRPAMQANLEAFAEITRRARETIWLTPEPRYSWGLGGCDLADYAEYCSRVRVVRDLTGLETAALEMATEPIGR